MLTPMTRIETWFSTHLPEFNDDLAPGCSEAALAETEALIGAVLPEDFKNLYRRHDGQMNRFCWGIFYETTFLSLSEVRRNWLGWMDVIKSGWDDIATFPSAKPGAVKEVYASTGWIPFAIDGGGNCLGIDLDPGPTGTRGQVINFGRDEDEKFVLAPSMNEFLEWFAYQLESGNFLIRDVPMPPASNYVYQPLVSQEPDIVEVRAATPSWRSLSTVNPPAYSLLDAIKVMFAWQRRV